MAYIIVWRHYISIIKVLRQLEQEKTDELKQCVEKARKIKKL